VVSAPLDAVFDGVTGEVRHGRVGGLVEDGERVAVASEAARVEQPEHQFVVTIGRETVVVVEVAGNRLA